MSKTLRFTKPVGNIRPFKSHRYDVVGLKVDRHLTHFSLTSLYAWVSLEADPRVCAYCERPLIIPDQKPRIPVDFWVQYTDHEELWILHRPGEFDGERDFAAKLPAFSEWAHSENLKLRPESKERYLARSVYLDNWGRILRDLTSNRRYVSNHLSRKVQEAFDVPRPLGALEGLYPDEDPVLLRTGAYDLLHAGKLTCKDLADHPVGPPTVIERAS